MSKQTSVVLTILIILGGVFLFNTLGLWETESSKIPNKTAEGLSDPGDIRGSYSFKDIENNFDISVAYLAEAYHIKENPADFKLKSLESLYEASTINGVSYEIGTGSVKYFVHLVTGIESDLIEPDFLPQTAVEMLLRDGYISENSEAITWGIDVNPTRTVALEGLEEPPLVKGNTTVQDILNLGVDLEVLEELLKTKLERGDVIKTICTEQGLSFSEIKNEITQYIK